MKYINENFMLHSKLAVKLYHEIAKDLPILDYHCHLSAKDVYENKTFENISQVWLGGDHYKWRIMRAQGVKESNITGNAPAFEKFNSFASSLEDAIANPIFHWSHLELKKYFEFDELLTSKNAKEVFDLCNNKISSKKLSPRKMILDSNVEFICTTDDPADDLKYHLLLQESDFPVKMVPGFRPDRAYSEEKEVFTSFISDMQNRYSTKITNYNDLIESLEKSILAFKKAGSNVSDHGINEISYEKASKDEISNIFKKLLKGEDISTLEHRKYTSAVLIDLAKLYKKHDFVFQLHFGAIRNNNSKLFNSLGRDVGVDSIADQPYVAKALNGLLNAMLENNALVKTIIYNLNPAYNDLITTTVANFQAYSEMKSKIQFGAAWWFNDTKRGMLNQMQALCDNGLIINFVGMLTDSRSYMSYTRHEYFRRILCDFIAKRVDEGDVPNDYELLSKTIKRICYFNAKNYFNL